MKNRILLLEKPWLLAVGVAGLFAAAVLIAGFSRTTTNSLLCSYTGHGGGVGVYTADHHQIQLDTILHYATSKITPQQSFEEITISLNVLKTTSPCNFLIFGLGYDSLMWSAFNLKGTTLFLEEDPKWTQTVLKNAPALHAHTVKYRTQLQEADRLLSEYRSEPLCSPSKAYLRGNNQCKLALTGLPNEVYDKEWDLIMIDAPKGYFAEAPGRMAAIFSAAVMARNRKGSGVTHVFLHDVDRRVEKMYAEEFLCRKNLVKATGRLWYFQIPPVANVSRGDDTTKFC